MTFHGDIKFGGDGLIHNLFGFLSLQRGYMKGL